MPHLSIRRRAAVPATLGLGAAAAAVVLVVGAFACLPASAQQVEPQQAVQVAPQISAAQIDQLVAPIALHPDSLLGQILSASTYPLEIVMAARWSAANAKLTGQKLEDAMQSQPWDPSVKALTTVPQVLKMMSDKLDWTQQLGEAYLSQPDEIAASVQRLRARADASGNLKSSEQVRVRRKPAERQVEGIGREYIVIEPAFPEIIYVPVYDPFLVYGIWPYPDFLPFYWYPRGYVSLGIFGFGPAFYVGPAMWVTYNWYYGRVFIIPAMYSTFNRVSITQANALATGPVKFDPAHRGLVGFKDPKLNTQFAKTGPAGGPTLASTAAGTTSRSLLTSAGSNLPSGGTKTPGGTTAAKPANPTIGNATNHQGGIGNTIVGSNSGNTSGATGLFRSSQNGDPKPARTISNSSNAGMLARSANIGNAGSFKPQGGFAGGGSSRPSAAPQGARRGR